MLSAMPAETTLELSETREQLAHVVDRVARGETRIVLEEGGQPKAVIISIEEFQRYRDREREAARAELFETFARFSDAFKDVSDEELERELAKAQAEVRAEMRAEREAAAART